MIKSCIFKPLLTIVNNKLILLQLRLIVPLQGEEEVKS